MESKLEILIYKEIKKRKIINIELKFSFKRIARLQCEIKFE